MSARETPERLPKQFSEIDRLAAVCRSHIHAGHSHMAAQCARRLYQLARAESRRGGE